MGVFSGSASIDSNGRRLADVIAQSVSENAVRRILKQIAAPAIGQIMLTSSAWRPSQGNILTKSDLPAGFDGWIYANGNFISESMFPQASRLFRSLSYSGKQYGGGKISVPNIRRFMKLSTGVAFAETASRYSMPDHVHSIGEPTATSMSQTVKRCVFIWSSGVDVSSSGGKMPAVAAGDFSYGGVTFPNGIPSSPSAHSGSASAQKYVQWDVPIDTKYVSGEARLMCRTDSVGQAQSSCEPAHVTVPVLIYIGEAS